MTVVAAVAGALGAGLLLPARSRAALLAGLALVTLATAGMAVAFAQGLESGGSPAGGPGEALPPGLAIAVIGGVVVLVGAAAVLVRLPTLVVPLLVAAAPFRPPLDPDPSAPLLLTLRPDALVGYHLPLYAVLAAATLALVWRAARGEAIRKLPHRIAWPAAALIALAVLSVLWTQDRAEGINQVMLYWLPAAVLVAVVVQSPVREWTGRGLAVTVMGLGLLFAFVGLVQVVVGEVLFSTPALAEANATTDLFRITSLFQDPSILGRYLAVAMVVALVALWAARARLLAGATALAVLAAALLFTYSQSSLVALVAGALLVAAAAGDRRARRVTVGVVVAGAIVAVAGAGAVLASGHADELTRNRSLLVAETAEVFAGRPIAGVGVGGQPVATRAATGGERSLGQSASHTTPLTVAAELGVLGLTAYAGLLAGTALVLRDLHRRNRAWSAGLGAVLVVLFVHALTYDGFFEAYETWIAIALAVAAAAASGPARAPTAPPPSAGARCYLNGGSAAPPVGSPPSSG